MAHVHPSEEPVLREDVGVADGVAGVVLHMLVHVVADHQIGGGAAGREGLQLGQHGLEGGGVEPVVAVHDLVVQAGGVPDALIDALAVAAVLLMDGLDNGGVLLGIFVADGGGLVLDGTVVHEDDLGLFSGGEQGLDAVTHISGRIIAGDCKCDQFLHGLKCSFFVGSGTKNSRDGDM